MNRRAVPALLRLSAIAAAAMLGACASEATAPAAVRGPRLVPIPGVTDAAAVPAGTAAPASGADADTAIEAPIEREPWSFGQSSGFVLRSERYRLHTTIPDGRLLTELPSVMEAALDHYTSALGDLPRPSRPLKSFIFNQRSEWAAYTTQRLPEEAELYLGIGRGGYTTDGESVLFNIGREDTFVIAIHEGWHQYTQSVFRERLPVWLEEGVACWMEGHRFRRDAEGPTFLPWRNLERFGELRSASRAGRLIPLRELLDSTPQSSLGQGKSRLLTYYAQVWALVHFLNEGEGGRYRDGLRRILADAAAGRLTATVRASDAVPPEAKRRSGVVRSGRWLAAAYFDAGLDELSAQYEAFVKHIVSGRGSRIWRGESPFAEATSD